MHRDRKVRPVAKDRLAPEAPPDRKEHQVFPIAFTNYVQAAIGFDVRAMAVVV